MQKKNHLAYNTGQSIKPVSHLSHYFDSVKHPRTAFIRKGPISFYAFELFHFKQHKTYFSYAKKPCLKLYISYKIYMSPSLHINNCASSCYRKYNAEYKF